MKMEPALTSVGPGFLRVGERFSFTELPWKHAITSQAKGHPDVVVYRSARGIIVANEHQRNPYYGTLWKVFSNRFADRSGPI